VRAVENELKQLLRDRAEEMRLPPEIPRPVLRRARRHRLINGALAGVFAIAVIAGGIVGVRAVLVHRAGGSRPAGPPSVGATQSPSATTEPTTSPSPSDPTLGLPFPVCDVSSVEGRFRNPDTLGTAYVATRRGDLGGCPPPGSAFTLIAIDLDGDGQVDASVGPIECNPINCLAFQAPDLDGNGTSELAVIQEHGSVLGVKFYAVRDEAIVPVEVAPPGDPEGGFGPGDQPLFWLNGGDAFDTYALRCEDDAKGRTLVAVSAVQDPPDRVDSVWKAHETTFQLLASGELHVTGTRDFQEPSTQDRPSFVLEDRVCGLNP